MIESKDDIERRLRLKEWFQSDPEIWQDIIAEVDLSRHNELTQLKARGCTSRDWSSGYVAGQEYLLDMESWLRRQWTPPIAPKQK